MAKQSLDAAKLNFNNLVDAERAADRERNAIESKLEAMQLTSQSRDGGAALIKDSRGLSILGTIASLIQVDSGWEAATAAALGTLSDAIVVRDLTSAVSALTTLRSENLGQADVLVYEPGSSAAGSIPSGLTPLTAHVRSSQISELLASLLATTVVVESARDAESILRSNPSLTVVTRDGDVITAKRARGGSASSTSLIEINALVQDLTKKLETISHTCDRLKFEIVTAQGEVDSKQGAFDVALSKLNESDARIAALTEQLAVSGQNMKSASAEVERLNLAIAEATSAKGRDENEVSIASAQLQQHGDIAEPDHTNAENPRKRCEITSVTPSPRIVTPYRASAISIVRFW